MKNLYFLKGSILSLILLLFSSNVYADRAQDSLVLQVLYEATGGDNWTKNNNWDTTSIDQWYGITLTENGRVSKIELARNGLIGIIPDDLKNLDSLQTFSIGNNGGLIPQPIPDWINGNNFPNLKILQLFSLKWTGDFPDSLQTLSKLESFRISGRNGQNGVFMDSAVIPSWIDSVHFPRLEQLDIQFSNRTGQLITQGILTLNKLTMLWLGFNPFESGEIPNSINETYFPNLSNLSLSKTNRNGKLGDNTGIPTIGTMSVLNLNYNEFESDSIPYWINGFNFPSLINLNLTKTNLNYFGRGLLDTENKITSIALSENPFVENVALKLNDDAFEFLRFIYTRNSNIDSLPQFDAIQVNTLDVVRNKLQFDDIERNSEILVLKYGIQDTIDVGFPHKITLEKNESREISLEGGGQFSYWLVFKDDIKVDSNRMAKYILVADSIVDFATYRYAVKNDSFPLLTLNSRDINVSISPSADTITTTSGDTIIISQPNNDELALIFDDVTNVDSLKAFLRNDLKGELRDSCYCGGPELWVFPDSIFWQDTIYLGFDAVRDRVKELLGNDTDDKYSFENYNLTGIGLNRGDFVWSIETDSLSTIGSNKVKVGLIGSGINLAHNNIAEKLVKNQSANCNDIDYGIGAIGLNNVENPFADELGHETFVAHNIVEVTGMTKEELSIINIKIGDTENASSIFSDVCGLHIAIEEGADIANISNGWFGKKSELFEKLLDKALASNMIIVTTAGNDSIDLQNDLPDTIKYWPASYEHINVVTTTSIDTINNLCAFSNWSDSIVDIATSGQNILSASSNSEQLIPVSGTSVSAGIITAAMARYMSSYGSISDVEQFLNSFYNQFTYQETTLLNKVKNGKVLLVESRNECAFDENFQAVNDDTTLIIDVNDNTFHEIEIKLNDIFPDGDFGVELSLVRPPLLGEVAPISLTDNSISYKPNLSFTNGIDALRYKLVSSNGYKCTYADVYIHVERVTGLSLNHTTNNIIIYPNPSQDHLYIQNLNNQFSNDLVISIYDVTGKKMVNDKNLNFIGSNKIMLENLDLPIGIYTLTISDEQYRYSQKFISFK